MAFISVLFGIAFGQIATGAVIPIRAILNGTGHAAKHASAAHYAVGLVLTFTSFVGYFASRNGPQLRIKFFNLPLVLISLDAAMVVVYFFVGVYADNGTRARPEVWLVCASFFLYVLWDIVGLRVRRDPYSQLALGRVPDSHFGSRRWVTLFFFAVSFVMAIWVGAVSPPHPTETSVIWWDIGLIALLTAYRVVKSWGDTNIRYRKEPPGTEAHIPPTWPVPGTDWERIVPPAVRDDRLLLAEIVTAGVFHLADQDLPRHAAAERLRVAGAVSLSWEDGRSVARATDAGCAYIELRHRDQR